MLEALGAVPGSPLEPAEALTGDRSGLRDRLSGMRLLLLEPGLHCVCLWSLFHVSGIFTEGGHEQGGKYNVSLAVWLHVNSTDDV